MPKGRPSGNKYEERGNVLALERAKRRSMDLSLRSVLTSLRLRVERCALAERLHDMLPKAGACGQPLIPAPNMRTIGSLEIQGQPPVH